MGYYRSETRSIYAVRTARRVHHCDGEWAHDRLIRPGDRYTLSKLPPGSDIGNVGWWRMKLCGQCFDLPEVQP